MKKGTIGVVIQVRMTSTRLPGKVLNHIYQGRPMLELELERLHRLKEVPNDKIIVATTTNHTDDPVIELCTKLGVPTYRGSETDVLLRYYEAAKKFNLDHIVRITGDCPFIDPVVSDEVIKTYMNSNVDYVSNLHPRTHPLGLATEIFSFSALEKSNEEAKDMRLREHVTIYIREGDFTKLNVLADNDYSQYRLTVDTKEDAHLTKLLYKSLYPKNNQFSFLDIVTLLDEQPEWKKINKDSHTDVVCQTD